jgi:hypothetical protein
VNEGKSASLPAIVSVRPPSTAPAPAEQLVDDYTIIRQTASSALKYKVSCSGKVGKVKTSPKPLCLLNVNVRWESCRSLVFYRSRSRALTRSNRLTRLTVQGTGTGPPFTLADITDANTDHLCSPPSAHCPPPSTVPHLFRDAKQPPHCNCVLRATASSFSSLFTPQLHSSSPQAPASQPASHPLRSRSDLIHNNRSVDLDNYSGTLVVECVRQSPPRPSHFVPLGRGEPLVHFDRSRSVIYPQYSKYDRRKRPECESYNRLGHRVC